jgi:hypothetical protein
MWFRNELISQIQVIIKPNFYHSSQNWSNILLKRGICIKRKFHKEKQNSHQRSREKSQVMCTFVKKLNSY